MSTLSAFSSPEVQNDAHFRDFPERRTKSRLAHIGCVFGAGGFAARVQLQAPAHGSRHTADCGAHVLEFVDAQAEAREEKRGMCVCATLTTFALREQ